MTKVISVIVTGGLYALLSWGAFTGMVWWLFLPLLVLTYVAGMATIREVLSDDVHDDGCCCGHGDDL